MGKLLDAIGSRLPDNSEYSHLPLVAEGTRTALGEIDTRKLQAGKTLGKTVTKSIEVEGADQEPHSVPVRHD